MKKYNKYFLTILLTVFGFIFSTNNVLAQINYRLPNPTKYNSLEALISAGASLLRPVFVLTFGAMIVYGGWIRLSSQGNADKIQQSVQIIVAAITGFVIAVLAPTIVDLISGFLGVDSVFSI